MEQMDPRDYHHLLFPVFLAGVSDFAYRSRSSAINVLQKIQESKTCQAAEAWLDLLQTVVTEQTKQIASGKSPGEVDWLNMIHQHDRLLPNSGLEG